MKFLPLLLLLSHLTFAQKKPFGFALAAPKTMVETDDFWEGTLMLKKPTPYNPFAEAKLTGLFLYLNNCLS